MKTLIDHVRLVQDGTVVWGRLLIQDDRIFAWLPGTSVQEIPKAQIETGREITMRTGAVTDVGLNTECMVKSAAERKVERVTGSLAKQKAEQKAERKVEQKAEQKAEQRAEQKDERKVEQKDKQKEEQKAEQVTGSLTEQAAEPDIDRVIDGEGLYLSHGFIDIHVHGGGGYDFMDGTKEAWDGVRRLHLSHGTTGLVATTMASTMEEMESVAELCNQYMLRQDKDARDKDGVRGGARILGLHMEGPYLAPGQCGAQNGAFIRNPVQEEYKKLVQICPGILRWTVAPELPGALEMGDYLVSRGILPSIGHSDAVFAKVKEAVRHGYTHVTHLYSAMSGITRAGGFRRGGVIESAYVLPELTGEVIGDGCHLPGELLTMAYRFIGPDRLALITDAMRAAGQEEGESILGSLEKGQKVIVEDGVVKMPDRKAFAGSVCTADRLIRNMIALAGASLPDAVKMATETPARIMGLSCKTGRIAPGRKADLVLFDENINVKLVMVDGKIIFTSS